MNMFRLFTVAMLAVWSAAIARADAPAAQAAQPQNAQAAQPAEDRKPDSDEKDRASDDEIRELVSTILMVRISRSLDLTDEQTVVLVRHLQDLRDEMSNLYRERDELVKQMRDLVDQPGVTDDELSTKLNQLISLDERRSQARRNAFEKASQGLTTKQKAKLYVTLQEFEGQMRRLVSRAMEMSEDQLKRMREEWGHEVRDGVKRPGDRFDGRPGPKFRRPGPEHVDKVMPRDGAPQPKADGDKPAAP